MAALKGAKITLRQAIASAEKAGEGRALNAGLEQVGGRSVWEILIQNTTQSLLAPDKRGPRLLFAWLRPGEKQ